MVAKLLINTEVLKKGAAFVIPYDRKYCFGAIVQGTIILKTQLQ